MTTIASSPFDRTDADIVLRTSDQVDFHVYKLFLSEAAGFFKTAFGLPQPPEKDSLPFELKDGIPVISMAESSEILDKLLRFCYPTPNPTLEKFPDVYAMLNLAEKYDMECVKEECVDPFSVYVIAHSLGREEETRKAARMTLRFDFITPAPTGLTRISGDALYALVKYHADCKRTVQHTLCHSSDRWLDFLDTGLQYYPCEKCGTPGFIDDEPRGRDSGAKFGRCYGNAFRVLNASGACESMYRAEELLCSLALAVDPPTFSCEDCQQSLEFTLKSFCADIIASRRAEIDGVKLCL